MRTQQEISDQMDKVQAQFPELANLTSTSSTSVFGLIRNIWIAAQLALDHYIDGVLANLSATAASVRVGTLQWYVDQVKAFQYGDPVAIIGGRTGYDVVDPAKRIVTQAAAIETDGRLVLKVAKQGGGQYPQALSDQELLSLKEYVRQVKYAGVTCDVVSLPPDELQIVATVKYDPQVMNAIGQRLTNLNSLPAAEAIIIYIRSLPFNSVLNMTELTKFVLAQPGIKDFVVTRFGTRPAGAADFVPATREVVSRAGYMQLTDYQLTYV